MRSAEQWQQNAMAVAGQLSANTHATQTRMHAQTHAYTLTPPSWWSH